MGRRLEQLVILPKFIKKNRIARAVAVILFTLAIVVLGVWVAVVMGTKLNMNVFEIILSAIFGFIPIMYALLLCIYSLFLAIIQIISNIYWELKWRITNKKHK
jgi:hypothetical protein